MQGGIANLCHVCRPLYGKLIREFFRLTLRKEKADHMDKVKPDRHETSVWQEMRGGSSKINDGNEALEYQDSFVAAASRCRELGWRLTAVDARELVDLEVNFAEPAEVWLQRCCQAGPLRGRVNLLVHTGSDSGLVVLEVESREGKSLLNQCRNWRSSCLARLHGREQHYFTLPPGCTAPPTSFFMAERLMVYGEGGLAPLPPSVDAPSREFWRWTTAPWESSPPDLPLSLWSFLQQISARALTPDPKAEMPTLDKLYHQAVAPPQPDNVIQVSRSRLDEVLDELRRVMEKAAKLEAVLLDWVQSGVAASSPAPAGNRPASLPLHNHEAPAFAMVRGRERFLAMAWESLLKGEQKVTHYSQLHTQAQKIPSPAGIEATVHACLRNNPELADDPDKLRMVKYCFQNYVNIDPDLSDLSLSERLERASQMANEFLRYS